MILEAVWFKDGKEVALCNPVIDLICEERNNISEIEVFNGCYWYSCKDFCNETPDDFVIRISKDMQ